MDLYLTILGSLLAAIFIWKIIGVIQKYIVYIKLYNSKQIQPLGKFHPFWGHMHLYSNFKDFYDVCDKVVDETQAGILSFWVMFFYPLFVVCRTDTVKEILKSTEPKSKQVGGAYFVLMPWLGDGLLLSDGKKWERNRRLLTPAFHFDVLKPYVVLYNKVFDIFLDKMAEATSGGRSVEVSEPVGLATLDTMLRCSLSHEENVQEKGLNHPYVNAVRSLTYLANRRLLRPWLYSDLAFYLSPTGRKFAKYVNYVHDFDEKVIRERKKALSADPSVLSKRYLDFLDILLTATDENGEGLTDREIRDEVDTFLFEGHDTTASAISWAIYALAKYPEEQQKVYEEVKKVLGDKTNVEWSHIQEFKRLPLFLKESMRMHSPVPGVARITTREIEIDGVKIPPNMEISILMHTLNNRKDNWTNAKQFRPDRFNEESERDPYSYVPFSAGPRNCIGQHFALNEQKVAIARLVQKFKVLPDPERIPVLDHDSVMRSRDGIFIKLEKR